MFDLVAEMGPKEYVKCRLDVGDYLLKASTNGNVVVVTRDDRVVNYDELSSDVLKSRRR